MPHICSRGALALLVLSLGAGPALGQSIAPETVIRNVSIVDVTDGSLLDDAAVAIAGDRIVFAGPASGLEVSDDVTMVDGQGGYVIPGLWDAHVHSVSNREWHFPLLIAHGVTSVRNMHTTEENPLRTVLAVKDEVASGDIVGPRFLANGAVISGPVAAWPQSIPISTAEDARRVVDAMADGGADFLKLYDGVPAEAFHALAERARERGIPFDGHTVLAVGPIESARAGQRTFEHASGVHLGCASRTAAVAESQERMLDDSTSFPDSRFAFFDCMRIMAEARDEALCRETARAYREAGSAAVPTLINIDSMAATTRVMDDEAGLALLPASVRGQWIGMAQDELTPAFEAAAAPLWDTALANVRLLHETDVTLIAGTDLGNPFLVPGHHLHTELELLVSVGLSPLEALQTATLHPARVFGIESSGQVIEGYEADLVVLASNPLEDVRNTRSITTVVLDGRIFDAEDLEAMKATAANFTFE